jgi:hypothetical protein
MASDEGWGVPASYAESFGNRLAHGYGTADMDRIWNELPGGLSALDRFAAAIAARLI